MPRFWLSCHKKMYEKKRIRMEVMYNTIEHTKHFFSYIDFAKMCQFIKYFTQLNPNFGKEDITFPLSYKSIAN